MTLIDAFCPDLKPLTEAEFSKIEWIGPMDHVGPVHTVTPLQAALLDKTNCAYYTLMVGVINLIRKLTKDLFSQRLNECSMEFIYLYQFDWRFPKIWHTSATFLSELPDKKQSVRESVPLYFLLLLYRVQSPFFPGSPVLQTSFLINLARHLAGESRNKVIEEWLKLVISRLDDVAYFTEQKTISLMDFPDTSSHLEALRHHHGTPLSIKMLDPSIPLEEINHHEDAVSVYERINFDENPLLRPIHEFEDYAGASKPFYTTTQEW